MKNYNTKRKFAKIDVFKLKTLVEATLFEHDKFDPGLIREVLGKDLKVEFDFENFDMDARHNYEERDIDSLLGYYTMPDIGLSYCGCVSGGDWEHLVFFILYYDGKKLRAYIPTDGNPWNTTTKKAYGNNSLADTANAALRWPDKYGTIPAYGEEMEPDDFEFDVDLIVKDIKNRFTPKEE